MACALIRSNTVYICIYLYLSACSLQQMMMIWVAEHLRHIWATIWASLAPFYVSGSYLFASFNYSAVEQESVNHWRIQRGFVGLLESFLFFLPIRLNLRGVGGIIRGSVYKCKGGGGEGVS